MTHTDSQSKDFKVYVDALASEKMDSYLLGYKGHVFWSLKEEINETNE